jgi:hypothetical protein
MTAPLTPQTALAADLAAIPLPLVVEPRDAEVLRWAAHQLEDHGHHAAATFQYLLAGRIEDHANDRTKEAS